LNEHNDEVEMIKALENYENNYIRPAPKYVIDSFVKENLGYTQADATWLINNHINKHIEKCIEKYVTDKINTNNL